MTSKESEGEKEKGSERKGRGRAQWILLQVFKVASLHSPGARIALIRTFFRWLDLFSLLIHSNPQSNCTNKFDFSVWPRKSRAGWEDEVISLDKSSPRKRVRVTWFSSKLDPRVFGRPSASLPPSPYQARSWCKMPQPLPPFCTAPRSDQLTRRTLWHGMQGFLETKLVAGNIVGGIDINRVDRWIRWEPPGVLLLSLLLSFLLLFKKKKKKKILKIK